MKMIGSTLKYMIKNIWYLAIFAFFPSLFMGMFLRPYKWFEFFLDYNSLKISNLGDVLNSLMNLSMSNMVLTLFAIILIICILSILIGLIETHFRTGKVNLSNSSYSLNHNSMIVTFYMMALILVYMLFLFIEALLIFITHAIMSGLGQVPTVANIVVTVLLSAVVAFGLLSVIAVLLMAFCSTMDTGYSFKTSLQNSCDLLHNKFFKFIFALILPFVVILPLVYVGNLFVGASMSRIIYFATSLLVMLYYPVLVLTVYFKGSGYERKDIVKTPY